MKYTIKQFLQFLFQIHFFLFLILLLIECKSFPTQKIPESKSEITIKNVLNSSFSISTIISGLDLELNEKTKTYSFDYGSEGLYWNDKGKFVVTNDKIELLPISCNPNCSESFGRGFCRIQKHPFPFAYKLALYCYSNSNYQLLAKSPEKSNLAFLPIAQSRYEKGEEVLFQKENYISTGIQKAVTKVNLKIRSLPNEKSEEISYYPDLYAPALKYIPKNTEIMIFLKTKDRKQVKEWQNHWYFVSTISCEGWVFGEFLEFK